MPISGVTWQEGDPLSPTYLNARAVSAVSSSLTQLVGPLVIYPDPASTSTEYLRVGSGAQFAGNMVLTDTPGTGRGYQATHYADDLTGISFRGRTASGTSLAPGPTVKDQSIVAFTGHATNTGSNFYGSGELVLASTETHDSTGSGTRWLFRTILSGGTLLQARWLITGQGYLTPNLDNTYDVGASNARARRVYGATGFFGTANCDVVSVTTVDANAQYFGTVYNSGGLLPRYIGRRAKGSDTTPSAVSAGNVLAQFVGQGYNGSNFSNAAAVNITADSDHTVGSFTSGRIEMATVSAASDSLINRWVVYADGALKSANSSAFVPRTDTSLTSSGLTTGEMAFACSGSTATLYLRVNGVLFQFASSATTVG